MESKRIGTKDLITVGVFGAIIFAITLVTSMVIGVTAASYLFIASGLGLVAAPVYFLAVSRANKRFVSFLIWTLNGLLWGIMGGYSVLVCMAVFSFIGELVLWNGGYRSFFRMSVAYCLSVFGYHAGVFGLVYTFTDRFIDMVMKAASSPSIESAQAMVNVAKGPIGAAAVAAVIVCSVISCLLAGKILKKHFIKAGIV